MNFNNDADNVRKKMQENFEVIKKMAENGDKFSMFQMGMHFENLNDLDKAKIWYMKAAEQGFESAIKKLKEIEKANSK